MKRITCNKDNINDKSIATIKAHLLALNFSLYDVALRTFNHDL